MSQAQIAAVQRAIQDLGYAWTAGPTSLSALPLEQRERRLGLRLVPEEVARLAEALDAARPVTARFPPAWDWRDVDGRDWTTPVRDQQACAASVAFATVAVLEVMLKRHHQDASLQPDLSEAHLFFCGCGMCCDRGCWPAYALDYARNHGVPDEACFPYRDHDLPCSDSCPDWRSRATRILRWKEVVEIGLRKQWLSRTGPMVGCMAVYSDFFHYAGGVYRPTTGELVGYHAVCVVGYSDAEACWICKNSWGPDWGESGWFKVGYGSCDIDTRFAMLGVEAVMPPGPEPPPPPPPPPPEPAGAFPLGRWVARLVESLVPRPRYARPPEPRPAEKEPAEVRLTNLWLSRDRAGRRQTVPRDEVLVARQPYTLHLQITPQRVAEAVVAVFPDQVLLEPFKERDRLVLDVVFFSPDTDFRISPRSAPLGLPRTGPSDEVQVSITPQAPGLRRLRACIYYGNVLLQSLFLEATVTAPGVEAPSGGMWARVVDYVASGDLSTLDEVPQPDLAIFTNQTADGTHWIGVYSAGDMADCQLRSGDLVTIDPGTLADMAAETRQILADIEELVAQQPSAPDPPYLSDGQIAWRERDLVRLACNGWEMFQALAAGSGLEPSRVKNLWAKLQRPGIVSVGRCSIHRTNMPWAALYDLELDPDKIDEIALCRFFTHIVASGTPLPDPQPCRDRPGCPLDGPDRARVVCPFGFWGFLHQVEQPLQHVPGDGDDPDRFLSALRNQTSRLVCDRAGAVDVVVAVTPELDRQQEHGKEIAKELADTGLPPAAYESDRDQVLALLRQGGKHLYYFFCHGEAEGRKFHLVLGPDHAPGHISAANLSHLYYDWPDQPRPLIILNGCETMALLPQRIHVFVDALRLLGASGVIGTEVEVHTGLARTFGRLMLGHFLSGSSLGEAVLQVRRHLLRQLNPLGLAYTYFAPATLHLHPRHDCPWCKAHPPTP
jgi:hypothetical protein